MNREEVQQEALNATEGKRRVGLGVSMGVGKTLIGLRHMNSQYNDGKRSFLVVAPKRSIYTSWKEDAEKFDLSHLLDHITFCTYRSLEKQSQEHDAIYLDECHSLLYSHELWLNAFGGLVVGLTGTPPRMENSEKGRMVNRFCPILYNYDTDNAIDDDILNDYKIIIHPLTLSPDKNFRVTMKNGSSFLTSELEHYNYWSSRIDSAFHPGEKQKYRIMRMQGLMQYKTKETYAKKLLGHISEKCIVFCNTTDQADRISKHTYHSKNSISEQTLNDFKSGKIDKLACVLQISEGVNIPGLKEGLILHAYSNERKTAQRIGRLLRLNPTDRSTIHVLMYQDTVDQTWVSSSLETFDASKVWYTDPSIIA